MDHPRCLHATHQRTKRLNRESLRFASAAICAPSFPPPTIVPSTQADFFVWGCLGVSAASEPLFSQRMQLSVVVERAPIACVHASVLASVACVHAKVHASIACAHTKRACVRMPDVSACLSASTQGRCCKHFSTLFCKDVSLPSLCPPSTHPVHTQCTPSAHSLHTHWTPTAPLYCCTTPILNNNVTSRAVFSPTSRAVFAHLTSHVRPVYSPPRVTPLPWVRNRPPSAYLYCQCLCLHGPSALGQPAGVSAPELAPLSICDPPCSQRRCPSTASSLGVLKVLNTTLSFVFMFRNVAARLQNMFGSQVKRRTPPPPAPRTTKATLLRV
jgi:hypothetical protein